MTKEQLAGVRRPPRKLERELVEVQSVAAFEALLPDLVLLEVMFTAEADSPSI